MKSKVLIGAIIVLSLGIIYIVYKIYMQKRVNNKIEKDVNPIKKSTSTSNTNTGIPSPSGNKVYAAKNTNVFNYVTTPYFTGIDNSSGVSVSKDSYIGEKDRLENGWYITKNGKAITMFDAKIV